MASQSAVNTMMQKFATSRGKAYYAQMDWLEQNLGEEIDQAVADKREEKDGGLLSFADLLHMLVLFEFPANRMKSFYEILQKRGLIKQTPYERWSRVGIRDSLIKLGYTKCPNPDCWRWFTCYCACGYEAKEGA